MSNQNYKRKVSELFSFKSPKSRKAKGDDATGNRPPISSSEMEQVDRPEARGAMASDFERLETNTVRSMETLSADCRQGLQDVPTKKWDVIIVGAGLSGLSAAKELLAHDMDVLVLEARDRVGGRTLTKRNDDDLWVDLGGSYVGPTQNHILNLLDSLGLETYLVEDSMDIGYMRAPRLSSNRHRANSFRQDNIARSSRFHPSDEIPFGSIFNWLDYVNMVRLIDSYGAQIPNDSPWDAPRALDWDAKTWKQFVDESTYTKPVRDYFNNVYVVIDVCADPIEVSMLWFLWYVKQCGGYGRSISTTNGGQERKIRGGTQQISEKLRDIIGSQRVLLNKPVCNVNQDLGPHVEVTATDGARYKADFVIYALSPHLWLKIHHEPSMPAGKNLLAQRSPMGQVAKMILYYEQAFWKEHDFSGCFIIDSLDRKAQPVILSLDETKPNGSHAAIIGFIAGPAAYETRAMEDQELAQLVARCYADVTNLDAFMNYIRIERFDWTNEQYSGGCYTTINAPHTLTRFGRHIREPFGRIYFAGTETALEWSGYMDGAISAGKRAARQILHITGNLDEQDICLREPDSCTVPPKPFEYPKFHRYAPNLDNLVKATKIMMALGAISFILIRHARGSPLSLNICYRN